MTNKLRKPVPKNQRQISIELQNPTLGNPNDSVVPTPNFKETVDLSQINNFRAEQLSVSEDTNVLHNVGIGDIDESIKYYFENVIKPQVYQNGTVLNIPVIYGNQERWKAVQKDGYYRDKDGKIMAPLIMYRRTFLERNYTIGNKLDANNPMNYAVVAQGYQKSNIYSHFDVVNNRQPVKTLQIIVIPDYMTLQYECTVWTYYIEQMNKVVESINYAANSYWGDPARFKFHARIDTFTNSEAFNQGEERLIKTNFNIKLNGYILPETINREITNIKKYYSKGKVTITSETSTDLSD